MSVEDCSIEGRSKSFQGKSGFEEDNFQQSNSIDLNMKSCVNMEKDHLPNAEIQNSLRTEILQLEKRLQDQVAVRGALEQALGYKSSSCEITNQASIPKTATELIKDIAVLEYEVSHLEQYLLSLYRKAFDQQIPCPSPLRSCEPLKSPLTTPPRKYLETSQSVISSKPDKGSIVEEDEDDIVLDSNVHRCHSSLSQHSLLSAETPTETLGKALRACHSQPLSMTEYAQNNTASVISLAEHLGTRICDHVPETPNKLSEDIIKCMSAIYCKLADPPLTNNGISSPTSSLSSISAFSPKDHSDMMWSPGFRRDSSSFDVRLDNPFHVQGLKEFSGPYSTMVEIQCIYKDGQQLGDTEHMLQDFRSLVSRLEEVDPSKLKHEEKLAFWINVHNALVMHAVLAYGIPQNNIKRVFLLLKAAYNVGGHVVSADVIQNSILGCKTSRSGKWLRSLLSSRTKFKTGDARQGYAIDHPEPLLHFALSSGCHSDPAVRVYTPKRVIQELETAKEEFVRATFGVAKDHKILLPKIVESFAKDSGLCAGGVMEMIQQCLPEPIRKNIKKHQPTKSRKMIEWVPHNFGFRYLICKELVK
ncbi:putative ternary complex factor MIP1, leucine-zipper [Helianthus annuus]|nr:putative ternary complex factor MIP1, leucine-zipper [Helianthus annuus]